ncbi:sigma factor-like helix-turn-helix DNA-binding protein [Cellulosilyticum ruminicola]
MFAYYIRGETLKNIAKRLELNYKTAENRKRKALEKLRKSL